MVENEKESYLALIAAADPEIRALLNQGFEFVTNAFKASEAPAGMKGNTDHASMQRLQREGYRVAISAAYDGEGHPHPGLGHMRLCWLMHRE